MHTDILQNQWSPIYDISAILTSIQSLLCDPNPASPANAEASRLYSEVRSTCYVRGVCGEDRAAAVTHKRALPCDVLYGAMWMMRDAEPARVQPACARDRGAVVGG